VVGQLGSVLNYGPKGARPGQPIGPDIVEWFRKDKFDGKPGIVAQWAERSPDAAQAWVKAGDLNGQYVEAWMKDHQDEVARWIKEHPDTPEPKPEDVGVLFFQWYSAKHPGTWPVIEAEEVDDPDKPGEKVQRPRLTSVKKGQEVQRTFYPMWREAHPDADLEPVPSDAVLSSGSGLDPDITLANALYQVPRVATAWTEELVEEGKISADKVQRDKAEGQIRDALGKMLEQRSHAPLGKLAGVPLVNVLEVNQALPETVADALK
jgi:K+-transporting ATPase ATPase C chain